MDVRYCTVALFRCVAMWVASHDSPTYCTYLHLEVSVCHMAHQGLGSTYEYLYYCAVTRMCSLSYSCDLTVSLLMTTCAVTPSPLYACICRPADGASFLQVHYILNEIVMGGMVLETSMTEIITRTEEQNRLEKQEVSGRGRQVWC